MELIKTNCFDKETADFKVVVYGKLKNLFVVGVYIRLILIASIGISCLSMKMVKSVDQTE